jgi:cell division protein FtsB
MNLTKYLKNKYKIITIIFLIWVLFLSDHDLFFVFKNCQMQDQLIHQKERLKLQIQEQEQELLRINTDIDYLEKYARKKYYFKKNNEVIFIDPHHP